ncbi:MAG TPA: prolyl oligopeptidase family serine peptidase [Pseudonocardiaceae bacterium]|nr:prolyl oligopeptidase family serine peptidase [Pseudonocardiaceae bacterium]
MPTISPCGTWTSPISAADAAAGGGGPAWVETHAGEVWWSQRLPTEGGRVTIMRESGGQVLPAPWNARNRVHEYGGRPFTLVGGTLVFTNWEDQRLYAMPAGGEPVPLTPQPQRRHGLRHAVPVAGPGGSGETWCIREAIHGDHPVDLTRELVAVPLDGRAATDPAAVRVLASSHRFLTEPKVSPDGRHVAWIGWDHPAMPWDGTQLCVAGVRPDGSLEPHRVLAGTKAGGPDEAVCQVEWDGPDAVVALTDPDGWWNLYRFPLDGPGRSLAPVEAELGGALWQPGARWFAPLGGGRYAVLNTDRLAVLDESSASVVDVPTELTSWGATLAALGGGRVAGTAGGPRHELAVVVADLSEGSKSITELTAQPDYLPDPAYLPVPELRRFPAADGTEVPALVYPPTNPDFAVPEGERPPYLVHVHGGPTSHNSPELDLGIAYFTSRGFGVVAPDYGGSTGHGRAFRERLKGQWGVVDVEDCAAVANALAAAGAADPERLMIRGGSAGGWTSAASLVFTNTYRCGNIMFPILDLASWTADGGETHDFEAQYLAGLVGALPQASQLYHDRSPINHLDLLSSPVLLMQGLDDQICPPAQAKRLAEALAGSGVPHAYLTFEGEQHGFRMASTIEAALAAELSFYGQVLGFEPPGVPRLELSS